LLSLGIEDLEILLAKPCDILERGEVGGGGSFEEVGRGELPFTRLLVGDDSLFGDEVGEG